MLNKDRNRNENRNQKRRLTLRLDGKKLIKAILEDPEKFGVHLSWPKEDLACPVCQTRRTDIREKGLAGCPNCYQVFSQELGQLIDKVQVQGRHLGRLPQGAQKKREKIDRLRRLKDELALRVEREEYEEAALLRDQIKEEEASHDKD